MSTYYYGLLTVLLLPISGSTKPMESSFEILRGLRDACAGAQAADNARFCDGALALLDKAKKASPNKREDVIKQGLDKINIKAESIDPSHSTGRKISKDMAALNNSLGRYKSSRRLADKLIEYDPNDKDAFISRSQSHSGLKLFDEAYADSQKALKLDGDSSEAYRARAMAAYGLGRYLQANEDARKALALDPNDRTAFAIMKLAEGKTALPSLDSIQSHMAAGIQREYQGLLQHLNQAEERRREPVTEPASASTEGLVRAAAIKLAVKDYLGALADADQAVTQDPRSTMAYYYRAAANNLLGRYEEAIRDATKALIINPSDFSLRDTRAWAFNHMGRFRDSIADSIHSLEINPRNAYALANLGHAHEQTGDLGTMLRELKAAAVLNPQFDPAYRDAAARHGLEIEPADSAPFAPEHRRGWDSRRKAFLGVLTSSLIGGVLIALGFLHLRSGREGAYPKSSHPKTKPSKIDTTYALGKTIGMGGMGVVYEAVDRALQRKVAVKMIREEFKPDGEAKARLLEEARTVAALHHPCIVDIHSIMEDKDGIYLIFEYLEGRTVDDIIQERKRLPLAEAKEIIKQACQALDYAHSHNVVHRDLKPANIMITDEGLVKVMDFGISRRMREAMQPSKIRETVWGTPGYMAPELREGSVRRESDIYSLAACLYEMLTGLPPSPEQARVPPATRGESPSQLVAGLPPELDRLLEEAMHPDPESRTRCARDFWTRLERIGERAASAS
ncbi:MAG: hypothetical protein A3J74_05030 [Elusimicrobia bacterium RIFCSPHIGHO2_02_FULL_57_9]|nr:MAG: hypothetical protein A3J74_05030 [Elusimicrobia bacterium RIFCSPHIGHO2_02_FULL_57_9]